MSGIILTVCDSFAQARGKTVICYFNFGAVQPSDCDFDKWYTPSNSATNLWTGPWYGEVSGNDCYCERYVDFKSDKVLNLLKARIKLAADSGCDGVDPDNIDIDVSHLSSFSSYVFSFFLQRAM